MLSLYDTVSKRKVPFVPLHPGRAGIYTCGPTVYRYAHVGNLRTYLLTDMLVRTLRFCGISTFAVQNITDMGHMHQEALDRGEDKVIAAARAAGRSAREIAAFFTEAFFRDCRRMNFLPADVYPRASEHVPEMIAIARALEEKGVTYGRDGYLYFDVTRAPGYGAMTGTVLGAGSAAQRTDPAIHRHKRRPEDFSLWLAAEPGREFSWDSPWGRGWPGWHVECVSMAIKYLGPEFDIHAGGIDLRFPHHENSRAMATTATGRRFAALWLHAAHLLVDGRKMSKSMNNEYVLDDLAARGFTPADFRYHCLTVHYRTPMNFTWDGQAASARALARLRESLAGDAADRGGAAPPERAEEFRRRFREAMEDDLSAPRALGVVHEAARAALPAGLLRTLAAEWDTVLGVGLLAPAGAVPQAEAAEPQCAVPPEIVELAARRDASRRARNFSEADALRERIRAAGYDVADAAGGASRIRRI